MTRRGLRSWILRLAPGLGVLLVAGSAPADVAEPPRLVLAIDTPSADSIVGDPGGLAFVAGKALAHYGELETFDIILVIDQSQSTSSPSGADIDGDGTIGRRRGESYLGPFKDFIPLPTTDDDDNVLAAEIAACEAMLEQLDPRTTRVGVVAFAGDTDPSTSDAWIHTPLTSDYERVREGLKEIGSEGPSGRTNMLQGVQAATVELIGSKSALSTRRPGARRIMLFLTDGRPTLPLEASTHQNQRMAVAAAVKAAEHGIRIDTFAVGEEALEDATATVEMARVTDGVFTPVMQPKDLPAVFERVKFSEIEALEIVNLTTRQTAEFALRSADGSFSALVPMVEGDNTVEVHARTTDGTESRRRVTLRFLADAQTQPLSPALLAARNRLMEARLMDLKQRSLEVQVARDEGTRRALQMEIERSREAAARTIQVEAKDADPSPPN